MFFWSKWMISEKQWNIFYAHPPHCKSFVFMNDILSRFGLFSCVMRCFSHHMQRIRSSCYSYIKMSTVYPTIFMSQPNEVVIKQSETTCFSITISCYKIIILNSVQWNYVKNLWLKKPEIFSFTPGTVCWS